MQTKIVAAFLDKGGVGKTTAVAHLGVAMNQLGEDVLLVDLAGKQGDLAKHFGLWSDIQADDDRWPNVATTFQEQWETIAKKLPDAVDQLIVETGEGPDLIPAHESLDGLDAQLAQIDEPALRYSRLQKFINDYLNDAYDVILLDLPGSTSNIAYNGLWASQNILAPVRPGPFEEGQAAQLRRDLDAIHAEQNVDIRLTMLMLNELDERTKAGRSFRDEFGAEYPEAIAPSQINSSQDVVNAQIDGQTLFALDEPSTTAQRAREAYLTNAEELLGRLE